MHAARSLQRVWRGHASRRRQKSEWRQTWDQQEQARLGLATIHYERILDTHDRVPAYESADLLRSQLRLLLHFQDFKNGVVRDASDTLRLLYFEEALQQAISDSSPALVLDDPCRLNLSKFGILAARHLESTVSAPSTYPQDVLVPRLTKMATLLTDVIPDEMGAHAQTYFAAFRHVIEKQQSWQQCAREALAAILRSSRRQKPTAYAAFAREVLTRDTLSRNLSVLESLEQDLDRDALSRTITQEVEEAEHGHTAALRVNEQLWQLSYLIYLHTFRRKGFAGRDGSIEALSALLGQCANEIAEKLDAEDQPMAGDSASSIEPFPAFVREMIATIPQQNNVRAVISELSRPTSFQQANQESDFSSAKQLANYAVALLRAFPSKAPTIRMWLYQGSITSTEGTDLSTIQYFWRTARRTLVFRKVQQNHRNVMSILREAAPPPETNQIGRVPTSPAAVARWRDEWRIILLFLELYTFVLKLMDDDEFFALDESRHLGGSIVSTAPKKGALPLADIALMTTFLKNLAFTLYWHAADLVETNDIDDVGGISALFGNPGHQATSDKPKPQTLTGNGVSQAYLKGLVTGLLRMLHERDSRRKFLPPNHWLMTSQVDMAGFIPAVVAEEEKRHELGDDEEEFVEDAGQNVHESDLSLALGGPGTLMNTLFGIREPHMPRNWPSRQSQALERQRNQARKKRQLESLVPRLEILRNLPFFIPFETRVQIFREFVYRDQLRRRAGYIDPDNWRMSIASNTQGRGLDGRPRGFDIISRHHAEIHRESVFEDAFANFYELGEGLKEPIQITFIDKFGTPEAGIDGGGVTKEFLMSVTSEAFDPKASLNMFQENEQRYLYPNPTIFDETAEHLKRAGIQQGSENFTFHMREFLRRFEFVGRVVGKCLYEGILIDVNFAGFFLLKWALTGGTTSASNETAYRATINDVREFDEELYHGLLNLKNYPGDVESDFSLDFTVTDTIPLTDEKGKEVVHTITRDLVPNGSKIAVTNGNRLAYIDRIVRYRLQEQPKLVTNAFLRGLGQIIQPMWLAMFNQKELQKLVGGDSLELDIADLRRNTQYGGLYVIGDDGLEHPTVQLFWKVLQEMNDQDRRKVLKFVTSTPRAPLLGFSHLNPKFSIRDSSEDQERLPSTSTCVNLLKLPRYGDAKTMREKLLYAINAGAGFDLS